MHEENHSELRRALAALLADIEEMYEGRGASADAEEAGEPEEFFGPFSVSKLRDSGFASGVSVSWPNLAISMRKARKALRSK